jgi:hypothetical protein
MAALELAGSTSAQPVGRPLPSTDPYLASLAYAKCLRAHGVPHPNPDRHGDFHLTPADEQRLRSVGRGARRAADDACFHYLQGLNLSPLSSKAIAKAKLVLTELRSCLQEKGYTVGAPTVRNLGRGRAFFGFSSVPNQPPLSPQLLRAQHACERRVDLDARLDKIIKADRANGPNL